MIRPDLLAKQFVTAPMGCRASSAWEPLWETNLILCTSECISTENSMEVLLGTRKTPNEKAQVAVLHHRAPDQSRNVIRSVAAMVFPWVCMRVRRLA